MLSFIIFQDKIIKLAKFSSQKNPGNYKIKQKQEQMCQQLDIDLLFNFSLVWQIIISLSEKIRNAYVTNKSLFVNNLINKLVQTINTAHELWW